jgi:hypothetical protein
VFLTCDFFVTYPIGLKRIMLCVKVNSAFGHFLKTVPTSCR